MLSVHRLHLLRELHRLGTVSEVAAVHRYSASAVSQQLARLEQEAGTQLVEKVGRRLHLTDAALVLVEHAERVLEALEAAESDLAQSRGPTQGTLRVASFSSVLATIMPEALTLLAVSSPQLRVDLAQREVGPAFETLLARETDVILGEDYPGVPEPRREGADHEDLITDPLLLAVPLVGPLADPRRLEDLAEADWALDPEDTPTGLWARATLRAAGFEPRVRFETADPLLQGHLVRSGHAAALIPELLAGQHLAGTHLLRLPGDPRRGIFTAARSGRSSHPAIRAFRAALQEAARRERPAVRIDALSP
ncbi:LysR substrate-binding domain-containing protein [Brachybacterium sp. DNPG3]